MLSPALPLLYRPLLRLAALLLPLVAVPAVQASAITYQITLTSASG